MSKNYYEILGISSNATEKEIASAYRKLALKYHPDKNKSPDAVERFREIKEAADFLLKEKGKSINSNNISDILEEIERIRVQNQAEMIEVIEKAFILFGASPQDLDPNLWSGYSDWKEKLEKLAEMPVVEVPTEFTKFQNLLYDKIVEAGKKKNESKERPIDSDEEKVFRDNLQNQQEEYMQTENNGWQQPEKKQQNFPSPTLPSPNDNSNNPVSPTNDRPPNDKPSEKKPKLSNSDWIKFLEEKIKYHEKNLPELPLEIEKKECQKKIDDLKKQLEKAKKGKENNQNNPQTGNDNENYENWTHEQLVAEITKLKSEIEALKKDKDMDSSEKQLGLRKKLEKAKANNAGKINKSDSKFPTGWVVGGGILAIVGLTATFFIVKGSKKKKKL